jgi:hypothetical protein
MLWAFSIDFVNKYFFKKSLRFYLYFLDFHFWNVSKFIDQAYFQAKRSNRNTQKKKQSI